MMLSVGMSICMFIAGVLNYVVGIEGQLEAVDIIERANGHTENH